MEAIPAYCPECGWQTIGTECENPHCSWDFYTWAATQDKSDSELAREDLKLNSEADLTTKADIIDPGSSSMSNDSESAVTNLNSQPSKKPNHNPDYDSFSEKLSRSYKNSNIESSGEQLTGLLETRLSQAEQKLNEYQKTIIDLREEGQKIDIQLKELEQKHKKLYRQLKGNRDEKFQEPRQNLNRLFEEASANLEREAQQKLEQLEQRLKSSIDEAQRVLESHKQQVREHIEAEISEKWSELKKYISKEAQDEFERRIVPEVEPHLNRAFDNRVESFIVEKLDTKVAERVDEKFKREFEANFKEHLDEFLISENDYIEIKKNIIVCPTKANSINHRIRGWLWLSGASQELLEKCPESEVKKQAQLGMSMLIPIIMGFGACFHVIRQHLPATDISLLGVIVISILWAMIVMTIDRTLLVTYRSGTNFFTKILQFAWRFAIALVLAIIFDAAILPEVFATSVQEKLAELREPELIKLISESTEKENRFFGWPPAQKLSREYQSKSALLYEKQQKLDQIKREIPVQVNVVTKLEEDVKCEREGGSTSSCQKGTRIEFKKALKRKNQENDVLNNLRQQKESLRRDVELLETDIQGLSRRLEELKSDQEYIKLREGELEKYKKAEELIMRSDPMEENRILFDKLKNALNKGDWLTASAFLAFFALFILADTFPIVMKFLMKRGLYDFLLDEQDKASQGFTDTSNAEEIRFSKTSFGYEITRIQARFAPTKSFTAHRFIQTIMEEQVDTRIRKDWINSDNRNDNGTSGSQDFGFALYRFCSRSPEINAAKAQQL